MAELLLIGKGVQREIEVPNGEFQQTGIVFLCQKPAMLHSLDSAAYKAFTSVLEIGGPPEPPIELVGRNDEVILYAAPYVLEHDGEGCVMMKLACVMRLSTLLRVGSDGMLVQKKG